MFLMCTNIFSVLNLGKQCSIDALLEKTIKHMLFLQSVTKHADKLKETGEPKVFVVLDLRYNYIYTFCPFNYILLETLFVVNAPLVYFS